MHKEYFVGRIGLGFGPALVTEDLEEAREAASQWIGYDTRIKVREVGEWELLEVVM